MSLKINARRQITLTAHVLDEMGVGRGDRLQLILGPDGCPLRPTRIDYSRLGTLRGKMPEGRPPFHIRTFRERLYNPALRN